MRNGISLRRLRFTTLILLVNSHLWAAAPQPMVKYFLNPQVREQDKKFVVINLGKRDAISVGTVLNSYRHSKTSHTMAFVPTGKLKVNKVGDESSIAEVLEERSDLSTSILSPHAGVMAGDTISMAQVVVEKIQDLNPELSMSYADLFVEPKASPATMSLSPEGKVKLKQLAMNFYAHKNSGVLVIKGFTDQGGASESNQVESYQRAQTVQKFLVEELGFVEEHMIAVGFGELSPEDTSSMPDADKFNRRIVFKMIPSSF